MQESTHTKKKFFKNHKKSKRSKKSPTKKDIMDLNNYYKNQILKSLRLTEEVKEKLEQVNRSKEARQKKN